MALADEYETHLTIRLDDPSRVTDLAAWGGQRGLKCVHILLSRGETASQPMLNRRGRGTLSDELEMAQQLSCELALAGFRVSRTKIEAAPTNAETPQEDADAATWPDRYFEHHVKLLLPVGGDLNRLVEVAQRHDAHLSRNALRRREDGYEERFVTQRCWQVGRGSARSALAMLLADLITQGHHILETEEEFVVFDSNLEVDAGWI